MSGAITVGPDSGDAVMPSAVAVSSYTSAVTSGSPHGVFEAASFGSMPIASGLSQPPSNGVLRSGGPLAPGRTFGPRYTIIRLLGTGGMGAVYQAWDQELAVVVALKVIRPDAMQDPEAAQTLERRFKRELLLARSVTHKNVVRIHDLGEIDGIKYITMPYIHGTDLATVLRRNGKLPVRRALQIARDIAAGLVAAHQASVVHRDLKPANIMLDEQDRAVIMDFGIARSDSDSGGATAGVVVGTLDFMAPEQARGLPVDHRADVYAFGLILYDMVTGGRPAGNETALSGLMARMQKAPPSVHALDPTIPETLDRVVALCTDPDPDRRYQKTEDLLTDLESLDPDGHDAVRTGAAQGATASRPGPRRRLAAPARWAAAAAMLAALAGGAAFYGRPVTSWFGERSAAGTVENVSLAILPFRNASGDASLDWLGPSIPETLRTEIGQSARLRTVPPDRLHQILTDLRLGSESTFDSAGLRRVAEFATAEVVLWGQYLRFGSEIRIDATLQDLKRQRSIPLKAQASGEAGLLSALDDLARSVRENLSLPREALEDLRATSLKPSSQSIQALRYYSEGAQLARQGKHLDARKRFEAAVQEDEGFALAYSRLAKASADLGNADEAVNYSRRAIGLADRLPPQEKWLIEATHATVLRDYPKAIEAYESLLKLLPDSDDVRLALGRLYEQAGALPKARDVLAPLVARDQKDVSVLMTLGRVETRLGNAQGGLEHLNRALALTAQFENQHAEADIRRAIGQVYTRLNKPDEAVRQLEQSLEIERRLNRRVGIANAGLSLASVQASLGRYDQALKGYNQSLTIYRDLGDATGIAQTIFGLGRLLDSRGEYVQALKYYKEALQGYGTIGAKSDEALTMNNIGNMYLNRGDLEEARTYFEGALTLYEAVKAPVDTARTLRNLAITAANAGEYDVAIRDYLRGLELRRQGGDRLGAARDSYSLGVVFEYQGRFGAALDAHAEALKTHREMGEGGFWLAVILAQQASALTQVGRFTDAAPMLDEAMQIAKQINHGAVLAQITGFQGDRAFYQGDLIGARALYEQAQRIVATTKDRRIDLQLKVASARLRVSANPRAAIGELRQLVVAADAAGFKHWAVESSVNLGEALMLAGDGAAARQELERAVSRAERHGLRVLQARGDYLLGALMQRQGNQAEARRHRDQARRIAEEIRKDARTDDVMKRADLRDIFRD